MHSTGLRSLIRCVQFCGCGLILSAGGCFTAQEPLAENAAATGTDNAAVTAEEATPRETLNKKTQNVLPLEQVLTSGGERAEQGITSTNPLLQSADAYRTSVAKMGSLAVQQAIQIRNAQSIADPKPLTHDQFMSEIIKPGKPDGIALAMLPYYQEYAWDEAAQELVVVTFPERIQEREKQR